MRFSLPFVAIAALVGLASATPTLETRQEAVRFGIVSLDPTSVKLGQKFTVNYNSTLARWQPINLDVYISGKYPSGFVTASYQLLRSDYPADAHFYSFETTLPVISNDDTDGYVANGSYIVTAFITYQTETGAISRGGVEAPIAIDLSS
ncbi:hypothetical protein BDY19DRAFT_998244 [Irpex rosettiformis]|uniref:Uncharacterized protein n=1 Tax=Irpex rosettiformis TaxID=378272 RepID=A0ACB8TPF1_9APHY|nr:hypothetical protein BDY19DRAFT_998244 [Irpex rosettiformis]